MNATFELALDLIRRPSITPDDAGCQEILIARLEALGFRVERLRFGNVDNLRRGMALLNRCLPLPAIPMWCRPAHWNNGNRRRSRRKSATGYCTDAARRT